MMLRIKKLLGMNTARDGLKQPQREAYVDLLLFCMYADNQLEMNQQELIEKEIGQFDWASGTLLETYINNATARVRAARLDRTERMQLLDDISRRLATERCRQHALDLSLNLVSGNRTDSTRSEKEFIEDIRTAFGISAPVTDSAS